MNERETAVDVFDKTDFLRRMMDDEELAAEIMSEYLVDMEGQLLQLKRVAESEEMPTLVRLAHTVKGASANVGAKALQAVAFEAEKAATDGDRDTFLRLVPEIESGFQTLQALLKQSGFVTE